MPRAPTSSKCTRKEGIRTWTLEEDQKLARAIEIHGPKRWRSIAAKAGLNRCGKSCRLRWMNYLRPNIKRGNISDQEEDLIVRLHRLLGNKWSLIAGRLPGRTDNEIKNYWNSHLSKKVEQNGKQVRGSIPTSRGPDKTKVIMEMDVAAKGSEEGGASGRCEDSTTGFHGDHSNNLFDFSSDLEPLNLEWVSGFLELDETWFDFL